ncbi:hypothetical protein DIPPA_22250 [Diplonema papillatum]|nr:hypothetical protein DIPPA_22250 [Diplonema papillatum]
MHADTVPCGSRDTRAKKRPPCNAENAASREPVLRGAAARACSGAAGDGRRRDLAGVKKRKLPAARRAAPLPGAGQVRVPIGLDTGGLCFAVGSLSRSQPGQKSYPTPPPPPAAPAARDEPDERASMPSLPQFSQQQQVPLPSTAGAGCRCAAAGRVVAAKKDYATGTLPVREQCKKRGPSSKQGKR